jgi:ATP-dependent protease ClpP protease subunit
MSAEQARDFGLVDQVITSRLALEQVAGDKRP